MEFFAEGMREIKNGFYGTEIKRVIWRGSSETAEATRLIQNSETLKTNCLMLLLKREEGGMIMSSYNIIDFVNIISCESPLMDYFCMIYLLRVGTTPTEI